MVVLKVPTRSIYLNFQVGMGFKCSFNCVASLLGVEKREKQK